MRFHLPSVGGVTVSIVAFQAVDPGSTPGQRIYFFFFFFFLQVLGDKEHKIIELISGKLSFVYTGFILYLVHSIDTKKDFENRVQNMLYSMPNHVITLDRFVSEYEKHSGHRLTHFYGHPKLLKLLEDIPDIVKVKLTSEYT